MVQVRVPGPRGEVPGHLALPEGDDRRPGVIVLPEVYGLNDDIRSHADHLASEGYVAFAPDLYSWGRTLRCIAATFATLARGTGRAFDDIEAARSYLADHERCTGRVGIIGFCMGAAASPWPVRPGEASPPPPPITARFRRMRPSGSPTPALSSGATAPRTG